MTRLIIVRHGNTFDPGDTVLRVGCGSDLALSQSGRAQADALGEHLRHESIAQVFVSPLKRTQETAARALKGMNREIPIEIRAFLNEIDYGPDEGQPEDLVVARIGKAALDRWDEEALPPEGWKVNPDAIIKAWQAFAEEIQTNYPDQTVLVVTSNGIARFAPHMTNDFERFAKQYPIKLSTCAAGCLEYANGTWTVVYWNKR